MGLTAAELGGLSSKDAVALVEAAIPLFAKRLAEHFVKETDTRRDDSWRLVAEESAPDGIKGNLAGADDEAIRADHQAEQEKWIAEGMLTGDLYTGSFKGEGKAQPPTLEGDVVKVMLPYEHMDINETYPLGVSEWYSESFPAAEIEAAGSPAAVAELIWSHGGEGEFVWPV